LDNTIFDDVFKTIIERMPKLVIPLVNEIFKKSYLYDEKVTNISTEHHTEDKKIISDSVLEIKKCFYHIECQSSPDSTMSIRMIEYDFGIALDYAVNVDGEYEMKFPKSAVIYLRHNKRTPDNLSVKVIFPDDSIHYYQIPIVKLQEYNSDEIFEKDLLMTLPFFIIKYEKDVKKIATNSEKKKAFLDEYNSIMERLKKADILAGSDTLYKDLISLMKRVADYVLKGYKNLQDEVDNVMGGKVLELPSDKLREQFAEGKKEGKEEGKVEGILETEIETFKRCIKEGMTKEMALKISGLPEDKIPTEE